MNNYRDIPVWPLARNPKNINWTVQKKQKSVKHRDSFTIKAAFLGDDMLLSYKFSNRPAKTFHFICVRHLTAGEVVLRSDYLGVYATPLIEDTIRDLWQHHDLQQSMIDHLKPLKPL